MGRRLENLQLDRMEDIFDDSFDPRATEKQTERQKDAFDLDPFGDSFLRDLMQDTRANRLTTTTNGQHAVRT